MLPIDIAPQHQCIDQQPACEDWPGPPAIGEEDAQPQRQGEHRRRPDPDDITFREDRLAQADQIDHGDRQQKPGQQQTNAPPRGQRERVRFVGCGPLRCHLARSQHKARCTCKEDGRQPDGIDGGDEPAHLVQEQPLRYLVDGSEIEAG